MKIEIVKDIEVDYWNARRDSMGLRKLRRGKVLPMVSGIEKHSGGFVNIHFEDGDMIVDIPVSAFKSVA